LELPFQLCRYPIYVTPRTADAPTADALRADARHNRDRVLAAARHLFARQGLSVSTNEVARHAGVGVATLLRRFPTRDDLVAAVFADKMTAYRTAITDALAAPDPWDGFREFIERVCAMQTSDRGFTDVLTRWFPAAADLEAQRDRVARDFATLIGRAKASRALRPDFAHQDLIFILMANAGIVAAAGDTAPAASKRMIAYLLQSFAAPGTGPLPKPPSKTAVVQALTKSSTLTGSERRPTRPKRTPT
jgi:AcrR family transcriptional regulator